MKDQNGKEISGKNSNCVIFTIIILVYKLNFKIEIVWYFLNYNQ